MLHNTTIVDSILAAGLGGCFCLFIPLRESFQDSYSGESVLNEEVQILNHIYKNENNTQRAIAASTGMSLGAVNLLLKKMTREGLIKIEQLTPKLVRYILTPQGMKEKLEKTYRYVSQHYRRILEVQLTISKILKRFEEDGMRTVFLVGPENEIKEIVQAVIEHEPNYEFNFQWMVNVQQVKQLINDQKTSLQMTILTWDYESPDNRDFFIELPIDVVYLMNCIDI